MITPQDRLPDPGKLLVTTEEAASILAISKRNLWTLTKNGEIPFVMIGRCKRYALSDLMRFIEQKTRTNKPAIDFNQQLSQ
jgi:excisionase family DNA binding protein